MRFGILGPLEVVDNGGRKLGLGGRKQRSVLAILLLHPNEAVSQDRLVEELWSGRPPVSAATSLQTYVSRLRRALGEEGRIVTTAGGYLIRVAEGELDVDRFERLVEESASALASGGSELASRMLREALGLWRGTPLSDFRYDSFAQAEIARLEELHLGAVEQRVEADLGFGRDAAVIGDLERLVREHPYREQLCRQLMLALYRTGRQADALAAYQKARSVLVEELGIEPSLELRELQESILAQDPSLHRPAARVDRVGPESARRNAAPPPLPEDASGAQEDSGEESLAASPLSDTKSPRQARKVVTALFCDMTGSTSLGEQLDPEVLREVWSRYFAEIRMIIERHGGTVEKFIGDAVMAVFGIPQVHEDDALRAVRAAAEIRERLPAVASDVGVELRFRTGVNTGRVLVAEGEDLVVGDAVNVAARLEQAAQPGTILIGEETYSLVRDAVTVEQLEPLELKGKAQRVAAYRVVSVDPAATGVARHLDLPLVGRERELALLRQAWDRAVRESRCHLLTLLGEAGVGKSRLVGELLSGVGDQAMVLLGRCLHYGEGITFLPLVEAVAPVGEPATQVLEHLSTGGLATPEELFWEVRRLLESLAMERPVVLHLDDLQWAEPTLLDLLDHIADLSRGAPILLLCTARPELLDDRPGWGGGKLGATTLLLDPLAAEESKTLLDRLGGSLDRDAQERVIAASQGNPLFLEEMATLAREHGTVEVPPTIQALLAARLEQLAGEERALLEYGAIEGEVFHRHAVRELADLPVRAHIDHRLAGLVRKELIRPHPAMLKDDEAFRFRHLLIRDAAYDALPKSNRAELHERFASVLEQHAIDLVELDEIAGWHLEQAVHYRRQLGRDADPQLQSRAAEHLHAAGTRAATLHDLPGTRNLLERALALAPLEGSLRPRTALALAESLVEMGDYAGADPLLKIAESEAAVAPQATLVRLEWTAHSHPEEFAQSVGSLLPGAIEELEQRGDARWLAKAHLIAAYPHWFACQAGATAEELRSAARYARSAADEGLLTHALRWYTAALELGPTPSDETARELDVIEAEQPGPHLLARLCGARATLASLAGRFDEARMFIEREGEQIDALGGGPMRRVETMMSVGSMELAADNPARARAALLEGDELLAEAGERGFRSTMQAKLAEAYELLGDREGAVTAVELAEALGSQNDLATSAVTQMVRARLALDDGDHRDAERWARSAVEIASRTDFITPTGEVRLELAAVLSASGRREEARAEAGNALALFVAKGHHPYAAKARALLEELTSPAAS